MNTTTKRRVRGWLLQLLGREPVGADGRRSQTTPEALQSQLFHIGHQLSIDEVREELSYLSGKRYVEMERFGGAAGKLLGGLRMGVRLVAAGQDVIDGTASEPGIDLGVFAEG